MMNEAPDVGPEYWHNIPDVPDYQASNLGRIRSRKSGEWKVLRATPHSMNGYLVVSLRVARKYLTRSVHRLVAATFLGDADGRDVNHRNGNKHDNRLANLEYLSRGDNHRHAYRTGLRPPVGAKLTRTQVSEIRSLRGQATQQAIGRRFGVSRSTIGKIFKGQTHLSLTS